MLLYEISDDLVADFDVPKTAVAYFKLAAVFVTIIHRDLLIVTTGHNNRCLKITAVCRDKPPHAKQITLVGIIASANKKSCVF